MSTKEMTLKIRKMKRLQAKIEELQAEVTAIQDSIKAEMLESDVEELKAGEFKVRYTSVTSNRFDSKAFKSTHADLYNQYVKSTQSRRFSVA